MKAAIAAVAPALPVIDLMHDAPAFQPRAAAYLLAALAPALPAEAVLVGVVDPGVGAAARRPAAVRCGGRWFVGPDNGLFSIVAKRTGDAAWWEIAWRPDRLSNTFHGRDLFAPVAARLAAGAPPPGRRFDSCEARGADWPDDLRSVIYIDRYGNAMTGLRAGALPRAAMLDVAGTQVAGAGTFSDVAPGSAMWYANSAGLVEIAVNRGSAAAELGLRVGSPVRMRRRSAAHRTGLRKAMAARRRATGSPGHETAGQPAAAFTLSMARCPPCAFAPTARSTAGEGFATCARLANCRCRALPAAV